MLHRVVRNRAGFVASLFSEVASTDIDDGSFSC